MIRHKAAIYTGAFFLAVALAFYFFLFPLFREKAVFNARVDELRGKIAAEQERHRRLQWERRMLEENNPDYLEKYARDNFGWARDGEVVYKLEESK